MGAYIAGHDVGSGLLGGYTIGACAGDGVFDVSFLFKVVSAKDFDFRLGVELTQSQDFDFKVGVVQITQPPDCAFINPSGSIIASGLPYTVLAQVSGVGNRNKEIKHVRFTWGDFTPHSKGTLISGLPSDGIWQAYHEYNVSGLATLKAEITDDFGYKCADCVQLLLIPSGIEKHEIVDQLPLITVSGVDTSGATIFTTQFRTTIQNLNGEFIDELDFSDGQSTLVNSYELQDPQATVANFRDHFSLFQVVIVSLILCLVYLAWHLIHLCLA
jgi:hypothetical protein